MTQGLNRTKVDQTARAGRTLGPLPLPMHVQHRTQKIGYKKTAPMFDLCGPMGRVVGTCGGKGEAEAVVSACNAYDRDQQTIAELWAALQAVDAATRSGDYASAFEQVRAALARLDGDGV